MLNEQAFLELHRTWSELGIAALFDDSVRHDHQLIQSSLGVGYGLLKAKRYEHALRLMETTLLVGLDDPWLKDLQARALLFLSQYEKASAIWNFLRLDDDSRLKHDARKMLSICKSRQRQAENEALEQAVAGLSNDFDGLMALWCQSPDSMLVQNAVSELLAERLASEDPRWSDLGVELQQESVAVEAHMAWLNTCRSLIN